MGATGRWRIGPLAGVLLLVAAVGLLALLASVAYSAYQARSEPGLRFDQKDGVGRTGGTLTVLETRGRGLDWADLEVRTLHGGQAPCDRPAAGTVRVGDRIACLAEATDQATDPAYNGPFVVVEKATGRVLAEAAFHSAR